MKPLDFLTGHRTPEETDPLSLHRTLAHWNHTRLAPDLPDPWWEEHLSCEYSMRKLEGRFIEAERLAVADHAAEAPEDPDGFLAWFEDLKQTGPGQGDRLFDWLAEEATDADMRWFLTQEAAGEAGFDDLVAMTLIKLPDGPKLELARNFWDEMGRGNFDGLHGRLLAATTRGLDLHPSIDQTCWESLALANTMTAFATTRRYAYLSVGALGVVELTAPGRVAKVAEGMKRLGYAPAVRKYFQLHAVLDVEHSRDWNEQAIRPLIAERPECAKAIAEGALIRLASGRRCFEAYRAELGLPASL